MTDLIKLVQVDWKDASDIKKNVEELIGTKPKDHLMERTTYGRYVEEDDEAMIIMGTEDSTGYEFVVIPKGMITKVTFYYEKRRQSNSRRKNR